MKKLSQKKLSQLVASHRKSLGMTQKQLSESTGINRSLISRLEKEDFIPSISQLEQLCEVLGFEPDQVVSDGNRVGSLAEIALRMEQTGYGTMEIESESNRGTRIVLRFPDCC